MLGVWLLFILMLTRYLVLAIPAWVRCSVVVACYRPFIDHAPILGTRTQLNR